MAVLAPKVAPGVLAVVRALRAQRRVHELSQRELAARAGVGEKHLGEIERGLRDPRLSTVIRLLDALNLGADAFAPPREITPPREPRVASTSSTAAARRIILTDSNERRWR